MSGVDSRSQFEDDSSAALRLSHSATAPVKRARGGDPVSRLAGPLQQRDMEERALIEKNEREIREREIRKLIASSAAFTVSQAAEIVDRERGWTPVAKKELRRLQAVIAHEKEVATLMDTNKKPAKHSGSSRNSRFKVTKAISFVCESDGCHLESKFCECVDPALDLQTPNKCGCKPCRQFRSLVSRRGRRPLLGRDDSIQGRVPGINRKIIQRTGLSTSDAYIAFSMICDEGVSAAEAVERILANCPVCPDRSGGVLCQRCSRVKKTAFKFPKRFQSKKLRRKAA